MPPKKKEGASKKTQEKVKQKIVEDKTFGLKNKKGKKQQTYIKNVQSQVQGNQKKSEAAKETNKLSKREQEKQKLEELNALFKPVQQAQKVAADTMEDWDQDTLEDVINKKHGGANQNKTDIVCKYFIEAVEKSLYGWFWNCPNGDKCIYRHALPPGYVLKKDKKREEEQEEKISLEELVENERNQLSGNLTPVTYETFLAWKKRKIQEKKDNLKKEMAKKEKEFKSGRIISKISGKEVFLFKPELADADDDEADDDMSLYKRSDENEEDGGPCTEINLEEFAADAAKSAPVQNLDNKLTRVSTLLAKDRDTAYAPPSSTVPDDAPTINDTSHTNGVNGLQGACAADIVIDGVPVDESLFEDLEDLDIE